MACARDPHLRETEAREAETLATQQVQGQPGLHAQTSKQTEELEREEGRKKDREGRARREGRRKIDNKWIDDR